MNYLNLRIKRCDMTDRTNHVLGVGNRSKSVHEFNFGVVLWTFRHGYPETSCAHRVTDIIDAINTGSIEYIVDEGRDV